MTARPMTDRPVTRRARQDHGLTLVEVVVAVSLLSVVSAVFLPLLATATRTVRPMQAQSQAIDGLRIAFASIGRELRSAACVAEPASTSGASSQLRFTTEADNVTKEVTYTTTGGELLRQVTGESHGTVLVTGLVSTGDAFTRIATLRASVRIVFHVQPDPGEPVRDLSTVMTARNAWRAC